MFFLDDMRLSNKVLIPLLGMALLFVGAMTFGALQLADLQRRSNQLVEHTDPAQLLSVRANRTTQRLSYDIYRILSYPSGGAEEAQAVTDFKASIGAGHDALSEAARLYPEKAGDFDAFRSRYDALVVELKTQEVIAETTNGFTLGSKDTPVDLDLSASVARKLIDIDKQIDAFSAENNKFNSTLQTQAAQAAKDLKAASQRAIWMMIIVGLAAVTSGVGLSLWITSAKIVQPLVRLGERMKALAGGALNVQIEGQDRGDEVGAMAKAVQVFKDNGLKAKTLEHEAEEMRATADSERARTETERRKTEAEQTMVVSTLAASLERLARGDLTSRIDAAFNGQYQQIKADFDAAAASLQDAMSGILAATGGIGGGADEIATASDDLSRRTERQAASLEETAAALDQITATVTRSADSAKQASIAVSTAKIAAEQSSGVMREAVSAMGEIERSSDQITQIIGTIDAIAFQTNLLALNAGVEAARAGDAGRGFAVVAQEVRALAQRSAEAAKEIKALIASSTTQVERGAKLVGDTGQALDGIIAKVTEIDALIAETAQSAQEQATGLSQVNTAVNQMDQVTQQNAAMVEEASAAAANLKAEAGELIRLVSRFQIDGGAARPARPELAQPGRPSPGRNPVTHTRGDLEAFTRSRGA